MKLSNNYYSFVRIFLGALLFFVLPVCSSCEGRKYNLPVENLIITKADGTTVSVRSELAVREEERNHGFMERKNIPDGTGMLFAFTSDRILAFWMKNTPHPLSIAYLDSRGIVCDIFDMKPFDETSIISTGYVRYALEVPQGWFTKAGVKKGDAVTREDGSPLKTIPRY